MTGRNRNERLSDAQRSALWYLGRGYTLKMKRFGDRRPSLHRVGEWASIHLRTPVALALLRRELIAETGTRREIVEYGLTDRGREVAAEIVAEHERKGA